MRSIAAVKLIQKRWKRQPKVGIILGTGAARVAESIRIEESIPYSEVDEFPQSTVIGHAGKWICGILADQPIVAMQGRFHLYEGHSDRMATLGVETMQQLGVELLLISNAAGGLNPYFRAGDVMVIEDHLNFMHQRDFRFGSPLIDHRGDSAYYDPALIQSALNVARSNNFVLHRGVYAGMLGPCYETRAEIRYLRRVGADVVGMSTVPEVIIANQLGIRVLAISIIANIANPDAAVEVSGQGVIDSAALAAPRLQQLFNGVVASASSQSSQQN